MEIKIKNKQPYWVTFAYPEIEVEFFSKGKRKKITTKKTICKISQERVPIAEDEVICSSEDKFVKEIGRVKSLRKTLELLSLTKEERTEFWNAYHSRFPFVSYYTQDFLDSVNSIEEALAKKSNVSEV